MVQVETTFNMLVIIAVAQITLWHHDKTLNIEHISCEGFSSMQDYR